MEETKGSEDSSKKPKGVTYMFKYRFLEEFDELNHIFTHIFVEETKGSGRELTQRSRCDLAWLTL